MQLQYVFRKQISRVDLRKEGTASIGIVLKDGVKIGSRPVIKNIKKGSVAYRSHCVSEMDAIVSVCGQDARGMSRKYFKHLLREAESEIELELEYYIKEACFSKCGVYRMERICLKLKKECESYGFVFRKNGFRHTISSGYPIISNIKKDGPADRDGKLKAGDRLLQIDDQDLEALSLSQVAVILRSKSEATFTIEYKIALVENSQIRLGERTNLEIDCPDADLGLVLGSQGSRMVIEDIRKGSLADRCGAFRVGDDILAINNIDVSFLSTSKANSLLQSFKKEPRTIVIVANIERLTFPRQNICLPRKKTDSLLNEMSPRLTQERDQQVPSNNHAVSPCDSSQSLFYGSMEDNMRFRAESDYYNFQIKSIAMLRELVTHIANLENFILSLNNNIIGSMENLNEFENNYNWDSIFQSSKMWNLKFLSTQIKNSAHSMATHLTKNTGMVSNLNLENTACQFGNFKDNPQSLNSYDVIQELMKNLIEIYTKKLMPKHNLEKLQLKINHIDSNCKNCEKFCIMAALATQKILLISSLNKKTKNRFSLIKKLIEDVLKNLPCKDCRVGSRSQTASEISETTGISDQKQFSFLNQLSPKPSCLTNVLKTKTCTAAPNGSDITTTTDVKSLDNLYNNPSNSVPSSFPHQTGLKSTISAGESSANETITKVSCRQEISNFKTKSGKVAQPGSHYRKWYQRKMNTANYSLCFETPSRQSRNDSEVNTVHTGSLGFATPICSTSLCDRASISGNSTPQLSTKTTYNTQNNSFFQEAELQPCKDNYHFEQKDNGKNYSRNIRKKIFTEKGLLASRRQNCKSAETIADSEGKSLKHSNVKIQKHSSEPQIVSPSYESSADGILNLNEKNGHFFANVEILYDKKDMGDTTIYTDRYWSPFHISEQNDHPNFLDIPNWSAKSSYSTKQTDQDPNQCTIQNRMDVTLKNEGKGYGLRFEFLDSPLENSVQLPRIIAVSSQGAAHKIGILQKGDRVLAINGRNTSRMTATEFDHLKEEAFSADEVLLTVEFDIVVRDLHFGTFDVCVTKTSKTGLVYNDFKKGSPLVVKGIVKGSPAHRCGSLFPGDEVLSANNIRQEFYDVFKNAYERTESVIIRIKRQTFKDKFRDEINLGQTKPPPFKFFDLTRTSIHSNHDDNNMFLEQELTLYRHPVAKDFGFLIGQDQSSKAIYVTGIRPDGPADCSKVIKKNDIILQVNGVDLEENKDEPVISFFHPPGDHLELKTRRIIKYE